MTILRGAFALLCAGLAGGAAAQQRPPVADPECFSVLGDGGESRICFDPARPGPGPRERAEREARVQAQRQAAARSGGGGGGGAFHHRAAPPGATGAPLPTGAGPPPSLSPSLQPVRALITPSDMPPAGVPAYGMVAFGALPLPDDRARFDAVCRAFRSTLLTPGQVAGTPIAAQMITFWPVRDRAGLAGDDPSCDAMIDGYDLKAGLDAIRDADMRKEQLAARRGPFLIAWSPSASRAKPDAVILVIDMSAMSSARSFQDVFVTWRQKIIDDPKFWRGGFSLETIRLALRDALDTYGAQLTPLLAPGK